MHRIIVTVLLCLLAVQVAGRLRMPTFSNHQLSLRMAEHQLPQRTAKEHANVRRDAEQCTSQVFVNPATHNPPPMRLKQPTLCDPDVRQYSGYVDLEDKHVFMWYFGSRARLSPDFNTSRDAVPLVFWFSGGPGCSSQIANWQENGPCMYAPTKPVNSHLSDSLRKRLPHSVQKNPLAWNAIADVVYIDQPVGTGFSHGPMPNSTAEAADTAWRTMQGIYAMLGEKSPGEARIKDVYLMGESYAGQYVPIFSEYIVHMNDRVAESSELRERGYQALPLSGIGIGNGLFDTRLQEQAAYTMGCNSTYDPLFTKKQCTQLHDTVLPACAAAIDACQPAPGTDFAGSVVANSTDGMRNDSCPRMQPEPWRLTEACSYANSYCNGALNWTTMISAYDVRPNARMVPDDYVEYLRSKPFTDAVGVDPGIEYDECSDIVYDRFVSTSDAMSRASVSALEYLLDAQLPVLLYSGDADFICTWYGTMRVANALDWHGKGEWAQAPTTDWTWPAQSGEKVAAGQFVSAQNFTFLRVYEAGHEVSFYQPQAALYMLAQFIDRVGLVLLGASVEDIEKLATIFWFTAEFRLCRKDGIIRACGAGLLSLFGELEHALSDVPIRLEFEPSKAVEQKYPITEYQPLYFVADSFRDATAKLREFNKTMKRPFQVRYNPYTRLVEVLDSKDKVQRFAQSITN
ncbi:hypothetical protein EV181_001255 [Coemansia sp. RSA 532]|nr:hypothetical protein EV181_001255 [Coemansia sp. RSA 532]